MLGRVRGALEGKCRCVLGCRWAFVIRQRRAGPGARGGRRRQLNVAGCWSKTSGGRRAPPAEQAPDGVVGATLVRRIGFHQNPPPAGTTTVHVGAAAAARIAAILNTLPT